MCLNQRQSRNRAESVRRKRREKRSDDDTVHVRPIMSLVINPLKLVSHISSGIELTHIITAVG